MLKAKIDPILDKQGCKKNTLVTCDFGYIKMIFTLLTEIVAIYVKALIIKISVLDFKLYSKKHYLIGYISGP